MYVYHSCMGSHSLCPYDLSGALIGIRLSCNFMLLNFCAAPIYIRYGPMGSRRCVRRCSAQRRLRARAPGAPLLCHGRELKEIFSA